MWWLALLVLAVIVVTLVYLARGAETVRWAQFLVEQEGDDRG